MSVDRVVRFMLSDNSWRLIGRNFDGKAELEKQYNEETLPIFYEPVIVKKIKSKVVEDSLTEYLISGEIPESTTDQYLVSKLLAMGDS